MNGKIYKFFILCKIVKNSNERLRGGKKAAVAGGFNPEIGGFPIVFLIV